MGERREHDNYSTPKALADWAVGHAMELSFGKARTIIEPCCGDQAPFLRAGMHMGLKQGAGFDFRPVAPDIGLEKNVNVSIGVNILKPEAKDNWIWDQRFDIVATNPPFIIGERAVRRSLELLDPYGVAVFLTKQQFLGTQKRSEFLMARPPAEVWMLTQRPSFTDNGRTDVATEYCFLFWYGETVEMRRRKAGRDLTTLHWLENKKLGRPQPSPGKVIVEKDGEQQEQKQEAKAKGKKTGLGRAIQIVGDGVRYVRQRGPLRAH